MQCARFHYKALINIVSATDIILLTPDIMNLLECLKINMNNIISVLSINNINYSLYGMFPYKYLIVVDKYLFVSFLKLISKDFEEAYDSIKKSYVYISLKYNYYNNCIDTNNII